MCFKTPKTPSVPAEDPLLKEQVKQATDAERARRSADKQSRLDELLSAFKGGYGRRSLLTGSRGGAGYGPGTRSLLQRAVSTG